MKRNVIKQYTVFLYLGMHNTTYEFKLQVNISGQSSLLLLSWDLSV